MLKFKVDYKPTPLKRPRLTKIGGKPVIHVLSEKLPDKTFKKIEPSLEDVFFTNIQG